MRRGAESAGGRSHNKECIVKKMIRLSALALMFVMSATLNAQEAPAQPPARPAAEAAKPAPVPLTVQLVLSRYQGEKKLSSVPYTLSVTANEGSGSARVRMGVQMPIPTQVMTESTTIPSYNYKDFGTNIDCSATTGADGRYKVLLTIADSSVYFQDQETAKTGVPPQSSRMAGIPAFRSFTSTFTTWLRDGQTSQYTSIPDQFSGQVLKIDATLTVLK
jgi:hypothetical protein